MKNYLIKTALFVLLGGAFASANSLKWLDDGEIVETIETKVLNENNSSLQSKTISLKQKNRVTLGTGQTVTLIGGVYVKGNNRDAIVEWANDNGYDAKKDKYIDNAVHIETSASESIKVANDVAKIKGVTTAAPKYRRDLIAK